MSESMDIDPGSPRGTKRKAETSQPVSQAPKRIKALDQDVVNKIAAGEIIVAPVHALKELIENAVDAGSTSLEIVVKDGGLKLLQITDNGHGINKDDLPILCERFTTSKLKTFEDLSTIGTYGFRGEALASISHIAHLTITTKTADSSCAWRARFADGKLVPAKPGQSADPKPTAGRGGTQITVEDLFYNVLSRQKAFRSPSEEYAKILDVVGRYAIHCTGVAFSCKKHGNSIMGVSTPSNASTVDCIRQIYGSAVASELIDFNVSDEKWGFTASGWTSNANYHVKKTTILLFINHRSVESSAIKKAIEQTYSAFLPKGGHPFIYLSLDIDPQRVDVNVHPTKREVNFLNEDEIIESICSQITIRLSQVDTSRTFTTQSLLPGAKDPTSTLSRNQPSALNPSETRQTQRLTSSTPAKPYENNLVRTDPSARKITSMLPPSTTNSTTPTPSQPTYIISPRERMRLKLLSVKNLRAQVREAMHAGLTEVFAIHTYIGPIDLTKRIVAVQGGVKLYLVDYGMVSNEYFYQLGLTDFGNFGSIRFETPLDIRSLIELGCRHEKALDNPDDRDVPWSEVPDLVTAQLTAKRAMLAEYFAFEISQAGDLVSLPLLMKGYTPSLSKLPRFLMRLGPCVDWENEETCFHTFLKELASFYTPVALPPISPTAPPPLQTSSLTPQPGPHNTPTHTKDPQSTTLPSTTPQNKSTTSETSLSKEDITSQHAEMTRVLEHVLFPAFKNRLVATKVLLKGVVEVADLKGLYRVFERC